jgi:hypothetical protein
LHNDSYFPIYYKNSKFKVGLQDFLEGTVHSIKSLTNSSLRVLPHQLIGTVCSNL